MIILLVSKEVSCPLSSIFKKIFSGIISTISVRVGIKYPPISSTFFIESRDICSINAFEFDKRLKNGSWYTTNSPVFDLNTSISIPSTFNSIAF